GRRGRRHGTALGRSFGPSAGNPARPPGDRLVRGVQPRRPHPGHGRRGPARSPLGPEPPGRRPRMTSRSATAGKSKRRPTVVRHNPFHAFILRIWILPRSVPGPAGNSAGGACPTFSGRTRRFLPEGLV